MSHICRRATEHALSTGEHRTCLAGVIARRAGRVVGALLTSLLCVVPLGAPAQAAEDLLAPLSVDVGLIGTAGSCTLTQSPSGDAAISNQLGSITEEGRNASTSNCDATLAPKLTSRVIVQDLGLIQRTADSGTRTGSGYGPLVATAAQDIPVTAEPGPQIKFTFISTLTTNSGATARICRTVTVDFAGTPTGSDLC